MVLNRTLSYIILAAITLLPWNATAVNSYNLGNLLPKPKLNQLTGLAENLLVKSLLEITQGKNQQALNTIDELINKIPNFKLAYLVRGDLLMAQAQHLQAFGNANINKSDEVKDLQAEARVRIERYLSNENLDKLPNLLLEPSEQQTHIIVVDTDKSRLYLYKNNGDSLSYIADYYVTVGKNGVNKQAEGDKRTPIGVYFAKPKLTQPLADMYGDGAYPLNYPNEWDSRFNRSGSGIWLHGTPSNTYSRPPNASDGCVVLTNQDIKALSPVLQSGKTPVVIANNLTWKDADSADNDEQALKAAMRAWLNDWKAQDTPKYLSHYSQDFSSDGIDLPKWSAHKFKVQAAKPKVDISLSNISMFAYPTTDNRSDKASAKKVVVVDFTQDFKSPSLANKMQKRQYWIQEGNAWKIIYEGAA
ncbi:MAG: L,D-transpeptidase family protein [Methylotenera sp.]